MTLEKLHTPDVRRLFQAVLALGSEEECFQFFDDLCTIGEIQSLAQRLEVAQMLQAGATYHTIESKTGASTATISRVKRCLHYGSDGYRLILQRLSDQHPENLK